MDTSPESGIKTLINSVKDLINPKAASTPDSLFTVVENIFSWFLLLIAILSVVAIIYAGITYITSAGNEEQATRAKSIITYAIIGIIVTILAYAIIYYVAHIF